MQNVTEGHNLISVMELAASYSVHISSNNYFFLFCYSPLAIDHHSCPQGISCIPEALRTWEPIKDIDILASTLSQGKNWQEFQVHCAYRSWLPFPYGFQTAFTPSENPHLRNTQQGLRHDLLQTGFDSQQHNLLETFCFCWKHWQAVWELLKYVPKIYNRFWMTELEVVMTNGWTKCLMPHDHHRIIESLQQTLDQIYTYAFSHFVCLFVCFLLDI